MNEDEKVCSLEALHSLCPLEAVLRLNFIGKIIVRGDVGISLNKLYRRVSKKRAISSKCLRKKIFLPNGPKIGQLKISHLQNTQKPLTCRVEDLQIMQVRKWYCIRNRPFFFQQVRDFCDYSRCSFFLLKIFWCENRILRRDP